MMCTKQKVNLKLKSQNGICHEGENYALAQTR